MKRSFVSILAVVAIAGCFDDPTSDLRVGPDHLVLDRSFASVATGDTLAVEAQVLDAQGNVLPATGATWTSDDPTIASVAVDDEQLAGGASSRAHIAGVSASGGTTIIRVTIQGVEDSIRVTTLPTDFIGSAVVAASAFGPNTQLTVTAQAGTAFNTTSTVSIGGRALTLLSVSPTTITAISPSDTTGIVKVTDVTIGTLTLDSLRTLGPVSISGAFFPGTLTHAGDALDTIVISGGAAATFSTTAPLSVVRVGATDTAMLFSRTANELRVLVPSTGTWTVTVTNVIVAGTTISSLSFAAPFVVTTTGEGNEPANDGAGGATAVSAPAAVNDTITFFGTVLGPASGGIGGAGSDADDYFSFTTGSAGTYKISVDWQAKAADIDGYIQNSAGAYPGLAGFQGATSANPENAQIALAAATSYRVYINLYDNHGVAGAVPYRVRLIRVS